MGFAEIIGHERQLEGLCRALANDRLHHAYLFSGLEGVGKRTTAMAMAMALHCADAKGDFCGRCAECARIRGGNHPDVRLIDCRADKKEISIQQVRDMEKDLRFRSFSGKRKVAIVDPATLLNPASQNALLKTLEEPPPAALLILIATSAGGLLPTVRSRCLRVNFGPLSRHSIAEFLVTRRHLNPADAELFAALGMGSLGAALAMNNEDLWERRRAWGAIVSTLKANDYRGAMDAAETIAVDRDETLAFLKWAETWYRDLLIRALNGDTEECVNLDMLPQLQEQAVESVPHILAVAANAAEAARKIQRNLNRRMVLEQFFFGVIGSA
jgi:DNA polymerase-3 subunit delta'